MSDNWLRFHYEGMEDELEATVKARYGEDATFTVGHKGGISVYEPFQGALTRIAYHASLTDLREKR